MTLLSLKLLGEFEARDSGGSLVDIGARKNRALLAVLALAPSGSMGRERIARLLWSDRADEQARSSLRQALAVLRKDLSVIGAEAVAANESRVRLDLHSVTVDAVTLQSLAASADIDELRATATLYRGELLADTEIRDPAFEDWLRSERARLADLATHALEKLWALERGPARVDVAKRLVALDPTRESAHRKLMQAYAQAGERALALRQYERCRDMLKTEFDAAPDGETNALRQSIHHDQLERQGAASAAEAGLAAGTTRSAVKPSIAVLPFNNMSGDPEQEYFSDGITEDIITDLSKISGLFVVSRNTTFTYKGRAVTVQQVSQDLRIAFILEGSVRKSGSRVRVTAQLVDGRDGGHLWAERYDRDFTDIFAIQDEITHAIVDQLKVRLLPEEKKGIWRKPTDNVEAYGYYLRGRQFLHRHSRSYYVLAKRMFAKAVALDPAYARALAGIADCDSFLFVHYNEDVSIDDILATSAKALDLEGGLAEAHASRGLALSLRERYGEAMAEFEQAITFDPNLFEAHYFLARACFAQGKLEEAARHFGRAADVDPDDYQALLVLTGVLRSLGRTEDMMTAARDGVARAERELALHPENSRPAYLGAISLVSLGEVDRAREWADRALAIDPDDGLAKYNVACAYSLMGDHERAIDLLLELLPSATNERKRWVRYDSDLDPLRTHPRFAQVVEQLG